MWWPGLTTFKYYVSKNMITKCSIIIGNISTTQQIYGTPIPIIKGIMIKKYTPENHAATIPLALLMLPPL